jgi:hypothetical protein
LFSSSLDGKRWQNRPATKDNSGEYWCSMV